MRTRIVSQHRRAFGSDGMMLVECIVYVALFIVVVAMAFDVFYVCWNNSKDYRRTMEEISTTVKVGEVWRNDVRNASGKLWVESAEPYKIMHLPQKAGSEIAYCITKNAIWRQVGTNAEWISVLEKVSSSRMELETRGDNSAWKWEIELNRHNEKVGILPLFTFEAVPDTKAAQ